MDWEEVLYHLDRGIPRGPLGAVRGERLDRGLQALYAVPQRRASQQPVRRSSGYVRRIPGLACQPLEERRQVPGRDAGPAHHRSDPDEQWLDGRLPFDQRDQRGHPRWYLELHYYSLRFGGQTGVRENGILVTMPVLEGMDFIRAEAYYRLGRKDEAAEIINRTRTAPRFIGNVEYPGLPPVTAAGVPESTGCVPRKPYRLEDGTIPCGDLWDALMYEKRVELHGIEALIPYADARGWGQLVEGTPIHFAVTWRELELIGYPEYSFGGVGQPGGAPPPTTQSP